MNPRRAINLAPLALAAVILGAALQVRDGLYSPLAVALLAAATVLVFLGFSRIQWLRDEWIDHILTMGLLLQLALLYTDFPGSHHHVHTPRDYWPFLAIISTAVPVAIALVVMPRLAPVALAAFVAIYLAAGIWLLRFTPQPLMDVFHFQRDACDALVHGINPYAITYPDRYGPEGDWVYGPGLVKDGRLLFGFPYMPLTLAMELPAHLLLPDYRYSLLLAIAGAALLIGWRNATRRAVLCAGLVLFTPRGFYLIEQGWCEPLVVLLLCATVVAAGWSRWVAGVLFGLLVVAKQYDLFMVPLGLMMARGERIRPRFFVAALTAAAVATLPIVLWDAGAFWHSAIALQFRQPFRADSLSFAALIANLEGPRLGAWVPLAAVIVASTFCLWRLPWAPASFAIAVAMCCLVLFSLSKQAFANYYFLVISALCCGVGRTDGLTTATGNVR
jgi:hypothetical protein